MCSHHFFHFAVVGEIKANLDAVSQVCTLYQAIGLREKAPCIESEYGSRCIEGANHVSQYLVFQTHAGGKGNVPPISLEEVGDNFFRSVSCKAFI